MSFNEHTSNNNNNNNNNNNSDDLQSAVDEARQLMDDIDLGDQTSMEVATSFTIDDDEDADEDVPLNNTDHPLMMEHPLAAVTANHPVEEGDPQKVPSTTASSPSRASSLGLFHVEAAASSPSTSLHSTPFSDPAAELLKQQAQRIGNDAQRMALNVFNMAQRAAAQAVQHTTLSTNNTINNNNTYPSSTTTTTTGHMMLPNSYAIPTTATSPVSVTTSPNSNNNNNNNFSEELSQEQKKQRLQAAVQLLQGEEVIMFLHPLWHVSDSTGASYQAIPNRLQLTCVMTFYRVLVFGYYEDPDEQQMAGDAATACMDASGTPWNTSCWPKHPNSSKILLQIPLSSIDRVDKSVFSTTAMMNTPVVTTMTTSNSSNTSMMGLIIVGKDNQRVIRITAVNYQDTIRAHQALQTYAFPGRRNLGYLFAFESRRQEVMSSLVTTTTTTNTATSTEQQQPPTTSVTCPATRARFTMAEFQRQFAPGKHPWMVYPTLNQNYQLCMSYPSLMIAGPATLNAETNLEAKRILQQCAQFRSEHRLPVLTWSSGVDGASLWRASQPKVGLQGNRSSADELVLKHILEAAASANAMSQVRIPTLSPQQIQILTGNNLPGLDSVSFPCLKIMDLRPRSAAMANRTGGYGYENTSNYSGTTLQFCGIDNIHKARDSYQKMSTLCMNPNVNDLTWTAALEDTKWLSMIRLILSAAWESAFYVQVFRQPVLVHCSHGWDRTSQVVALSQLLLDPYYRTREGFSTLVEKDFMSFGHPFHTRCAHGEGRGDSGNSNVTGVSTTSEGQISPIFVQFLDCVFQLVNQYPECFEFNTKYLLVMSEHVYSCRFGTFLCDSEREREIVAGIRQRTHSLWDYMDARTDTLNTSFRPEQGGGVMLMPLPTLLRNITLWTDRHCMHGPKPTTRWLPTDLERPSTDLDSDQQGSFVTSQEIQGFLVLGTTGMPLHTGSSNEIASTEFASSDSGVSNPSEGDSG